MLSNRAAHTQIAAEYGALLALSAASDYGSAEPAPHETCLAVRRRLSADADRRGWALLFVPVEGESLIFQVRTGG